MAPGCATLVTPTLTLLLGHRCQAQGFPSLGQDVSKLVSQVAVEGSALPKGQVAA